MVCAISLPVLFALDIEGSNKINNKLRNNRKTITDFQRKNGMG
jgi:hypothetical protein